MEKQGHPLLPGCVDGSASMRVRLMLQSLILAVIASVVKVVQKATKRKAKNNTLEPAMALTFMG